MTKNTTVAIEKTLAKLLKSTARRLGFSSISRFVEALYNIRQKCAWTAVDMQFIAGYGLAAFQKLEDSIVVVSASSDAEAMEKLNLTKVKKIADSEFPVTEKMPKTDEVFKETK
jgi:hypothetical protein